MRKYKNNKLKWIKCDCCGDKVKSKDCESKDFITIKHHFGYGSYYDTMKLDVDLCEECLFDMLNDNDVDYRLTEELYD